MASKVTLELVKSQRGYEHNRSPDSSERSRLTSSPREHESLAIGTTEAVKLGCHVIRATGMTAYLANGDALEHAQEMAAYESPCTTKLYDRTGDEITLDEVTRIRI